MDVSNFIWPLITPVLLVALLVLVYFVGYRNGKTQLTQESKEKQKRSKRFVRSVLGGLFSEQVAPFLPDFPADLKASEARFIGKPVDFLIFKGMDEKRITEVVFVEVKSGNSQLTQNERDLRDVIQAKKVRWCEYRVDKDISDLSSEIT